MKKGISIHIGLNYLSEKHYGTGVLPLDTCEQDALDMHSIALNQNFKSTLILLSESATRKAVTSAIISASQELHSGDILMLSYSGHGGFLPDVNGDEIGDNLDETWCLYDGQLIDDELFELWSKFEEDVRIVIISDSCHSGTVAKTMLVKKESKANPIFQEKLLSHHVAKEVYLNNKEFYSNIEEQTLNKRTPLVKATIKLFAACQDPQVSYSIPFARNSIFTEKLLKIWNQGAFMGNYEEFFSAIKEEMKSIDFLPTKQTPHLDQVGKKSEQFKSQQPFKIDE